MYVLQVVALSFFFGHSVVCPSIYGFVLPLWYLQTLLIITKIPKGQSEAVNQRTDNNTMAKSKRTNGQAMSYKTLHRKLKLEQHNPIKNRDDHRCPDNVYKWSNISIGVITGAPIMYINGAT